MRGEILAENRDLARRRQDEAEHHRDRRRLARAVAAEERGERALRHREADAVDRDNVAIALDQALDRNGSARSIMLFARNCHRVDNRVHLLSAIRSQGAGH